MTAPLSAASQYASAAPYLGKSDVNLQNSPDDNIRVRAYRLYEDMYFNRPETFKVTMRGDGTDSTPIYIPSAKKMVDATSRFLGKDFNYVVDPGRGTPQGNAETDRILGNLFRRERIYAKWATNKRFGLIRGDALWHITADDTKLPGQRISIHELNPANYFVIEDPDNPDRILGCHIVDVVQDPAKPDDLTAKIARRQTYLKAGVVPGPLRGYVTQNFNAVGITSELAFFELGKWDNRNMKAGDLKPVPHPSTRPQFALPPTITSLPIYHWRNNRLPDEDFGMSEVAGVESLINAINQSITDEDLTLIMQGLGMYWTNARPPKNADGTDGDWIVGPGVVVEVGDTNTFGRVTGVSSVAPFQEHMASLKDDIAQSIGVPAIAQGKVDVAVAESGISLALQLAPILAKNAEKEEEMLGIFDQLLYDLVQMWLPAFEQASNPDVSVASLVGDAMPENRDSRIQEILLLQAAGLITIAQAQAKLTKYGWTFEPGDEVKVVQEAATIAAAQAGDVLGNRYAEELTAQVAGLAANVGQSSQASAALQSTGPATSIGSNGAAPAGP